MWLAPEEIYLLLRQGLGNGEGVLGRIEYGV